MANEEIVIVVPMYKNELSSNELFSLSQCFKILKNYEIIAVKPFSLDISKLQEEFAFSNVVSFENKYFDGIAGYNELMLSDFFYNRFANYQYMLIYQLDAFVFTDHLKLWCNKNYDYIGAPWIYRSSNTKFINNTFLTIKSALYKKFNVQRGELPNAKQFRNKVGNGGFSLRKIEAFYRVLINNKELAKEYIERGELEFNEDIFFSVALNRHKNALSIPNYKIALSFAIETEPEIAFALAKEKLPFGCHGWDKNLSFWRPILEKYGYKET